MKVFLARLVVDDEDDDIGVVEFDPVDSCVDVESFEPLIAGLTRR